MYDVPEQLNYTPDHLWVEDIGDGKYRIGITDFAQHELGDIVFVEMPELGREYTRTDTSAVIESVKSATDIACPLSGKVVERNALLEDSPEIINSQPYTGGWLFVIEAGESAGQTQLIGADAYAALMKGG